MHYLAWKSSELVQCGSHFLIPESFSGFHQQFAFVLEQSQTF